MGDQFITLERNFTLTKKLGEDGEFEGYASVFDVEDHHGDTVKKGAFKAGLQKLAKDKRKLKMLYNHRELIGVYKDAHEDDTGLWVRGKLSLGVRQADEALILMRDEALDSMSIGGYVRKEFTDQKTWKRDLIEIELREVSPVIFPANDAARINSVKSLSAGATLRDAETILRDAGFSRNDTKTLVSIIKGAPQRDVDAATINKFREAINSLKI